MPTTTLHNPHIQQKQTYNQKTYFLIKENSNSTDAYFAFEWTAKEGWTELVNNYSKIKELDIEYTENGNYKQVISLDTQLEGEIIL